THGYLRYCAGKLFVHCGSSKSFARIGRTVPRLTWPGSFSLWADASCEGHDPLYRPDRSRYARPRSPGTHSARRPRKGPLMRIVPEARQRPFSSTRRSFIRGALIGSLVCKLAGDRATLRAAAQGGAKPYDLLIRGGRVIDPSQSVGAPRDVAIAGRTIAKVAESIAETDALHVLDVRGLLVTPGWIDLHVHVYDGGAPLGIPPDPNCVAKGVTTVLDAGSAGAHTFPGFRKYVIDVSQTRIRALLNISVVGQSTLSPENPHGELLNLSYANPTLAARTIEQHRDVI